MSLQRCFKNVTKLVKIGRLSNNFHYFLQPIFLRAKYTTLLWPQQPIFYSFKRDNTIQYSAIFPIAIPDNNK